MPINSINSLAEMASARNVNQTTSSDGKSLSERMKSQMHSAGISTVGSKKAEMGISATADDDVHTQPVDDGPIGIPGSGDSWMNELLAQLRGLDLSPAREVAIQQVIDTIKNLPVPEGENMTSLFDQMLVLQACFDKLEGEEIVGILPIPDEVSAESGTEILPVTSPLKDVVWEAFKEVWGANMVWEDMKQNLIFPKQNAWGNAPTFEWGKP